MKKCMGSKNNARKCCSMGLVPWCEGEGSRRLTLCTTRFEIALEPLISEEPCMSEVHSTRRRGKAGDDLRLFVAASPFRHRGSRQVHH